MSPEDLIEACREQLGSMKKPSDDPDPHRAASANQLGKRSRRELREAFWPGAVTATDRSAGPDPMPTPYRTMTTAYDSE